MENSPQGGEDVGRGGAGLNIVMIIKVREGLKAVYLINIDCV